jgi:hypothetical protein
MLIEKLAAGVVQVQTPIGPRYVMPSFLQRVYLLWMFRHFAILPHAVLNRRQQRLSSIVRRLAANCCRCVVR